MIKKITMSLKVNYAFFSSVFVHKIHWWTLTLNNFSIILMQRNVLLVKDGSRLSSKHFRVSVFWQVCIVKAVGEVLKTLLVFFLFWHCSKLVGVLVKWGNPLEGLQRSLKPLWLAMPSSKMACFGNWSGTRQKKNQFLHPRSTVLKQKCTFLLNAA